MVRLEDMSQAKEYTQEYYGVGNEAVHLGFARGTVFTEEEAALLYSQQAVLVCLDWDEWGGIPVSRINTYPKKDVAHHMLVLSNDADAFVDAVRHSSIAKKLVPARVADQEAATVMVVSSMHDWAAQRRQVVLV